MNRLQKKMRKRTQRRRQNRRRKKKLLAERAVRRMLGLKPVPNKEYDWSTTTVGKPIVSPIAHYTQMIEKSIGVNNERTIRS